MDGSGPAEGDLRTRQVLVGLVPLRSVKNAHFMDGLFGVHVPRAAIDMLERAGTDAEQAGVRFTIDVARRICEIAGISGLHLMGMGRDDLVRTIVEDAVLFPRPTSA